MGLVASAIHHNLLEHDGRVERLYGECVRACRCLQGNGIGHHTARHGGVVDAIDVVGLLVEQAVEIALIGWLVVDGDTEPMAALVLEVECLFDNDIDILDGMVGVELVFQSRSALLRDGGGVRL